MTYQRHHEHRARSRPSPAVTRHPALPPLKTAGEMTLRGTIHFYDRERGYGFVRRQGEADVFLHSSVVSQYGLNAKVLEPGTPVRFCVHDFGRGPRIEAIALAT